MMMNRSAGKKPILGAFCSCEVMITPLCCIEVYTSSLVYLNDAMILENLKAPHKVLNAWQLVTMIFFNGHWISGWSLKITGRSPKVDEISAASGLKKTKEV